MAEKAKIIEIADALAAELATGSFTESFTPERSYQPTFDLADLKTLKVTVVPKTKTAVGGTRGASQDDYDIDVAVQKKLGADPKAESDALMLLVEKIADHLRGKRLAGASWLATQNEPVFAPEHIEQFRQFTSVLTVMYRATR